MFLKYPREVISISTSYINSPSEISVIKKCTSENKKKYVIEPFLSSDIEHTTEIYTPFGRFKILVMNNCLFLKCEQRKVSFETCNMNKNEYIPHSCIFISSELDSKLKNYLTVLSILNRFKEQYLNELNLELNKKIQFSLSHSLTSLRSSLELYNCLCNEYPNELNLSKTNTTLLHKVSDLAESFSK